MHISVDTNDRRPIYEQVMDEIRNLIARGELREGAALPPVRQLAADLGVNLNTIATAYRELQAEGLLTIRHGSGAVVAARTTRETGEVSADELRRTLRGALTRMALAGMPRAVILSAVTEELRALFGRGR
ncbi:MAG: GntR family transcriptional regulator [Blastocatellia bacterium]